MSKELTERLAEAQRYRVISASSAAFGRFLELEDTSARVARGDSVTYALGENKPYYVGPALAHQFGSKGLYIEHFSLQNVLVVRKPQVTAEC